MNIICPSCGLENRQTAKFCDGCGKSISGGKKEEDGKSFALINGTVLKDRYFIKELIKVGGMGAVYKAIDRTDNRIWAVKELWTFWATSTKERQYVVEKFESEARILAELDFISLPKVIDYFINNERYYLVMEYIEGCDLDIVVEKYGSPGLEQEKVIKWGIQMCEVLEHLHYRNPPIIYRDLKPSNIIVREADDRAVLIDFGIACYSQEGSNGSPRTMIGTMGYMPPEQFLGKVSTTSDIFSLGATLYYLLTGTMQVLFGYKSMTSIVPSIPERLDDAVRKALEFKPENRYQTATEMKAALERIFKPSFLTTKRLSEVDLWIGHLYSAEDRELKLEALKTLATFSDPKVVEPLADILVSDEDHVCRQTAAISLGKIKSPIAMDALIEKTKDTNNDVRIACIKSLGNFKEEKVFNFLIQCLKSRDSNIRKTAAISLGEIGNSEAIEPLLEARSKESIFNITVKKVLITSVEKIKAAEKARKKKEQLNIEKLEKTKISPLASFSSEKLNTRIDEVLQSTSYIEKESFELEEQDILYQDLIKELLNKDFTSITPVILMNRDKFDKRFFELLDFEFQEALEKNQHLADDMSYLMRIIVNLRLRDMPAPQYVPRPEELERIYSVRQEKNSVPEEQEQFEYEEIEDDEYSDVINQSDLLKMIDTEYVEEDIEKRLLIYKDILRDNPSAIEEVFLFYRDLKEDYPDNLSVTEAMAWVFMKKCLLKEALKELISTIAPQTLSYNSHLSRFILDSFGTAELSYIEFEEEPLYDTVEEDEVNSDDIVEFEEGEILYNTVEEDEVNSDDIVEFEEEEPLYNTVEEDEVSSDDIVEFEEEEILYNAVEEDEVNSYGAERADTVEFEEEEILYNTVEEDVNSNGAEEEEEILYNTEKENDLNSDSKIDMPVKQKSSSVKNKAKKRRKKKRRKS